MIYISPANLAILLNNLVCFSFLRLWRHPHYARGLRKLSFFLTNCWYTNLSISTFPISFNWCTFVLYYICWLASYKQFYSSDKNFLTIYLTWFCSLLNWKTWFVLLPLLPSNQHVPERTVDVSSRTWELFHFIILWSKFWRTIVLYNPGKLISSRSHVHPMLE